MRRNEETWAIILGTIACVVVFLACCIGTRPNIELATEEVRVASGYTYASEVTATPTAEPTATPTRNPYVSLGEFKITAYCPCSACCGKSDGLTSLNVKATEGRTIAADPNVLPYGTKVTINGNTYIVEDCGVSGRSIDIFMYSHEEALIHGVQYAEVFIKNE